MATGRILLTFASVCIGVSAILAVLFRFWPRYGSVTKAVERADHLVEQLDAPAEAH